MPDTIELLEAIGRDASLRYASADELTKVLGQARASGALIAAAATGDKGQLTVELGQQHCDTPQVGQGPGHEEEQHEEEDNNLQSPPAPDRAPPLPKR